MRSICIFQIPTPSGRMILKLNNETLRRPVGEINLAAGTEDTQQFIGGPLLVRCEDHSEGRQLDVKTRIRKRQLFGICFLKGNGQALGGAFPPAPSNRGRQNP
jgi:hypothetical protein